MVPTRTVSSFGNLHAAHFLHRTYALRIADALGVPLNILCDEQTEVRPPRMKSSPEELPLYLQNFILNEAATPYLQAAHRMSKLPKEDSDFLTLVIDLLAQRRQMTPAR